MQLVPHWTNSQNLIVGKGKQTYNLRKSRELFSLLKIFELNNVALEGIINFKMLIRRKEYYLSELKMVILDV